MYNSLNDAANAGLLNLVEVIDDESVTASYHDEVASTLTAIADIYETYLSSEEKAALSDTSGNYNAMADPLYRMIEIANVILGKYIDAIADDSNNNTPTT